MERAGPNRQDDNHKFFLYGLIIAIVSLIHASLLLLLGYIPVNSLEVELKIIKIELISPQPTDEPKAEIEILASKNNAPISEDQKIEVNKIEPSKEKRPIPSSPKPMSQDSTNAPQTLATSPNSVDTQNPPPDNIKEKSGSIAPQWTLAKPQGIDAQNRKIGPPSLEASLDCLKGFSVNCADQRKEIFAAEQLTQTDLVWMPSFAHSGLNNADLYGLSEAEIRERHSIPTAGNNGVFIPFTNIGLDGPLWDALHGVNKTCSYKGGIVKPCPELRKAQKDLPFHRQSTEFDRPREDK